MLANQRSDLAQSAWVFDVRVVVHDVLSLLQRLHHERRQGRDLHDFLSHSEILQLVLCVLTLTLLAD